MNPSVSSTSGRRPYAKLKMALNVDSVSSGEVPALVTTAMTGAPSLLDAVEDLIAFLIFF
jgi:hypothetical protein